MTRDEWIAAFASEAGVQRPAPAQIRKLLSLAGIGAHASERTAAPLACWIAGRSDRTLDQLLASAEAIGADGPQPESAAGRRDR